MAKSKYAPALFEVIQNRQNPQAPPKLALPKWWKVNRVEPPADQTELKAQPTEPEPLIPETVKPAIPVSVAPPPSKIPLFTPMTHDVKPQREEEDTQLADDRITDDLATPDVLRLSFGHYAVALKPATVTVVAGAFLLLMFITYELGHHFGKNNAGQTASVASPSPDDIEQAVNQPPKPSVLTPARPTSSPPARSTANTNTTPPKTAVVTPKNPTPSPTPESPKPATGLTYVVLENFHEHKDAAEFAQKWLESKNYPTRLEQRGSSWRLVSTVGFDYSSPAEKQKCVEYCDKVKALGKTCSKELSRAGLPNYNFSSPGRTKG